MMKKISLVIGCILWGISSIAQESQAESTRLEQLEQRTKTLEKAVNLLEKVKISGYIQTQYQSGQKDASLKVGAVNENTDKSFSRIGIRRGRIKFAFEEKLYSAVFQIDLTEKGLALKDAYMVVKEPWIKSVALKAGVFDRPFGYEISYSSSKRESPERSLIFQTLFPDERDLGAMLTIQAPQASPLHFLKLEGGLFAGNGIKQETDSRRDFIGHFSAANRIGSRVDWGAGLSYYNGSVYQSSPNVYKMKGDEFALNNNAANKGAFAKREYFGVDGQMLFRTNAGTTQLRGEYLFGTQPGTKSSGKSPNSSSLPEETDTYIRNFRGGYAILVQALGSLPLSAVLKYEWYDPNTKVSKDKIGEHGTGKGDVAFYTTGVGLLWDASKSFRVQAYYEFVNNEKSKSLSGYEDNRKDNLFTLRMQYKF